MVWLQLTREGLRIGRDRVARPMARLVLDGLVRGKAVRTTTPATQPLARQTCQAAVPCRARKRPRARNQQSPCIR
ncbi:MAG: hypothetical protein KF849_15375 [Rhizobiaceae bacterium]|nr:hypothetical protein [Rhizobiaceae bacterium]